MSHSSRRSFLQHAIAGAGAAAVWNKTAHSSESSVATAKLPREVWIASYCQDSLGPHDPAEMISQSLKDMESMAYLKPDVYCLPEVFPYGVMRGDRPPLSESAETPPGPITRRFADFAAKHQCYVICPIYTKHNGRFYNAAVVIDRQGKVMGEYQKIHTTVGETDRGITPGPLDAPVFKTDFGIIGVQICFDINWQDGWKSLRQKGAEIIFWPSAFGGGQQVNTKAWQNKCCVVSSTRKGTTKICDLDGTAVVETGHWNQRWAIAPLNLEKVFLHTWPYVRRFEEIQKKYGRNIRIKNYHEEEWTIIESLSQEIRVADILKEFDLKTHEEHIDIGEREQIKHRAR